MTDKEKYDFIDHVVHLTLLEEDRLLNEHGGDFSGLEEDGIDSNEYYRIITERVINTLKKNNNYMQEESVSSMWHDSSEEPKPNMELICVGQYGNPLVLSSNSDSFKSRYISKWAYFNDLINLSNVQTTVKDWKEEPISEELEEAIEDAMPDANWYIEENNDTTGEDAYNSIQMGNMFKAGAKWQKEQMMNGAVEAKVSASLAKELGVKAGSKVIILMKD